MRIPFSKWSPGGNITILLERPLDPADHMPACAAVIAPSHLYAEQSGTVDVKNSPPALRMLGGEFCVNATRAFAALLALLGRLEADPAGYAEGLVSVSGMDTPLKVRTRQLDEACFEAYARIPLYPYPAVTHGKGYTLVELEGIKHLLLDAETYPLPSSDLKEIFEDAAMWRTRFGLTSSPAAGVIRLDRSKVAERTLSITPVVWVRDTQTECLETACGSGSLAAALSQVVEDTAEGVWTIHQPGGESLSIAFERDQEAIHAWVGGTVNLLARGETFVPGGNSEG